MEKDDVPEEIGQALSDMSRKLCPRWMGYEHYAHYLDVRRALVQAYKMGVESKNS